MNNNLNSIVKARPDDPVFAFRPTAVTRAAEYFLTHCPAQPLYAVKTNPEPAVIQRLWAAGIRAFDVASLDEILRIKSLFPQADLFFMNTVKPRHVIREAYFKHQIRHFSLDCLTELTKILEETNYASDLHLFIRIAIPNNYAQLDLSEKFGIQLPGALELIHQAQRYAAKTGICFHVGSQCMHPNAYRIAMRIAHNLVKDNDLTIDYLDIGGGFPSIYPGMTPPPLSDYFAAIQEEFLAFAHQDKIKLICEPGRALVAESTSAIVRVDLRKDYALYINDGTYGSLFDAGVPRFVFPTRLLRSGPASTHLAAFKFYGPTCDTLDCMQGPFYLPEDIAEGDYIEIGQLGAYGKTMASHFNGFNRNNPVIEITDPPLMTLYHHTDVVDGSLKNMAA